MARRRVVIVGGVAGGATCAAHLRRLDKDAEIVILDCGHYISFANCGLPYFVGNVIQQESQLLLASPGLFRERFDIEVRLRNEIIGIDRQSHHVIVREVDRFLAQNGFRVWNLSGGYCTYRVWWPEERRQLCTS